MKDAYGLSASGIPPELQAEMLGLARKQQIAQALMAQGQAPMEMPQQNGRFAGRASPLSAFAKMVQAYTGHQLAAEADTKRAGLATRQQQAVADAMMKYEQTRSGSPGVTPLTPNDDEGNAMPSTPAVKGDPRAAIMQALGDPSIANNPMVGADLASMREGQKPFNLRAGEKRYDGTTVVAENIAPAKPEGPKLGQLRTRIDGTNETQEEFDGTKWNIVGSGPRFNPKVPSTNVTVNAEKQEFKNEKVLRDEFTKASEPFVKVRDAYTTVKGTLGGDITAPATLAGATKFMKMLDPESVVRESELQMALKSTGMLDRFMNLHNTVMKGGVLTPTQAQEIQRIAGVLYEAAGSQQTKVGEYYTKLANDYKLDSSRVVRDLSAGAPVETKTLGGKTYVKRGGQWYQQ